MPSNNRSTQGEYVMIKDKYYKGAIFNPESRSRCMSNAEIESYAKERLMINQRKQYDDYMKNAKKHKRVRSIDYDAHTGKRVRPGDELNVTFEDCCYIVACALVLGFIVYLSLGN